MKHQILIGFWLCLLFMAPHAKSDDGLEKGTLLTFNTYIARVNGRINELRDILGDISAMELDFATGRRENPELFRAFLEARSAYRRRPTEVSRRDFLRAIGFMHRSDREFIRDWQRTVSHREERIRNAYMVLKAAVHDIEAVELTARYISTKQVESARRRDAERRRIRDTIINLGNLLHSIDRASADEERIGRTMQVLFLDAQSACGSRINLADTVGRTCTAFEAAYFKIRSAKEWTHCEKKFVDDVVGMVKHVPRNT